MKQKNKMRLLNVFLFLQFYCLNFYEVRMFFKTWAFTIIFVFCFVCFRYRYYHGWYCRKKGHSYEILSRSTVLDQDFKAVGIKLRLECTKCGKRKVIETVRDSCNSIIDLWGGYEIDDETRAHLSNNIKDFWQGILQNENETKK